MIDVDFIYRRIRDLSRENKSGQLQNEMFNRTLTSCENILYDYHQEMFERDGNVAAAMHPFIKKTDVNVIGDLIELPDDYRHRISLSKRVAISEPGCENPEFMTVNYRYMPADKFDEMKSSFVRKPDLQKGIAWHSLRNGTIEIAPRVKKITIRYLREPVYGNRVVVEDTDTLVEAYDQAASTDLEWPMIAREDLINLMLMQFGVSIKETPLVQYAASRLASVTKNVI